MYYNLHEFFVFLSSGLLLISSNINAPPSPNFSKNIDYVSWYKEQVSAKLSVSKDSVLILDETALRDTYAPGESIDTFLGDILSKPPGWHRTDHESTFDCLQRLINLTQEIDIEEKFSPLFQNDYDKLLDISLPHIGNDKILAQSLIALSLKHPFDENRFLNNIYEALKIVKYGQYNNYLLIEKRVAYSVKNNIYDACLWVFEYNLLSDTARKKLYDLILVYENNSLYVDLSESIYPEQALSYEMLQNMSGRTWLLGKPRLKARKVQEYLSLLGNIEIQHLLEKESLAQKIARESPKNILERLAGFFTSMVEYISGDEHVNPAQHFRSLRERYLSESLYLNHFGPPDYEEIFQKVYILEQKRKQLLSTLENEGKI